MYTHTLYYVLLHNELISAYPPVEKLQAAYLMRLNSNARNAILSRSFSFRRECLITNAREIIYIYIYIYIYREREIYTYMYI